ncbi:MAG: leucyl aminopeptidase family protein [Chthonomonas sp.]|nr:leucyl aminopeptidase family protein [Chthonomonas sp.]
MQWYLVSMFASIKASTGKSAATKAIFVDSSLKSPKGISLPDKFKGKKGEIRESIEGGVRTFFVGTGDKDSFHAAGTLGRKLAEHEIAEVAILGAFDAEQVGAGLGVIGWNPTQFKGTATPKKDQVDLNPQFEDDKDVKAFKRGLGIADAMNLSRDLSITPPNIATTDYIAATAEKLAKDAGLAITVMKGKDLEKEKLVGHINVGKASENLPVFIRLEYKPKGSKGKPVVLVGKTMCYDTGGLSLKISGSMVGMKQDKDGGCAVIGAMHLIAKTLKPDVPVVALLCVAENSVSDEAYRPDDILTFRNGVTVEVTNTDAEGRLVLADGLCWACDKEEPAVIVDIATLTGGVVTALGKVFAGGFGNDESSYKAMDKASASTGERVWRLPLHDEYRDMMKSPVADILNSNPNRQAHPIQGAAFLSYFVKEGTPWIHLDIAGVHNAEKDSGPFIKGPNGFGVRLLAEFAASWK